MSKPPLIETPFHLEIYMDRATLPTIQQVAMIVANKNKNKKLICWLRHPLTDQNLLNEINAESCLSIDDIYQRTTDIISPYTQCQITIFANTYWSKDLARLLRKFNKVSKIVIKKLELIDDGSSEYQKMYAWEKICKTEQLISLSKGEENLKSYLLGSENRILRFVTRNSNKLPRSIGSIFNWHKFFPTTYHMLRMDYLEKAELKQLKEHLKGNTKQIRWDYLSNDGFTLEQESLFYNLAHFKPDSFQFDSLNCFMFIGVDSTTASSELQIRVISDSLSPNGIIPSIGETQLVFKGHPFADFNQKIVAAHKMHEMDPKVPFETLIMTGLLPKKIGGMESSLYFSLPDNYKIEYIVFNGTAADIEKHPLIQIMLYLDVITIEQIIFSSQLNNSYYR